MPPALAPNKKLRIAIWHNAASGGTKRALFHHVQGLLERGHEIESWCPPTANLSYLPLSPLIPEHVVPLTHLNGKENKKHRFFPETDQFRQNHRAMVNHCRQCAEAIHRGGFDLLLANTSIYYAASPIGRFVKLPKAIYLQEPARFLYEARPGSGQRWQARASKHYQLWPPSNLSKMLAEFDALARCRVQAREEFANVKAFDAILANSAYSRESMVRTYGLDAQVCYLGIDDTIFYPADVPRERYVIGLGAFDRRKGVDFAVKALAAMPEAKRPKLIWIADSSDLNYREQTLALAKELKVELEPKSGIPDAEIVHLLQRASAMIYTSVLEPFGFAPLEANACGTPAVAVAEGGVRETIKHGINGLLVPDRDPVAFATELERLLDAPDYARQLGQAGLDEVRKHWTWEKAIDRLENSLYRLLRPL